MGRVIPRGLRLFAENHSSLIKYRRIDSPLYGEVIDYHSAAAAGLQLAPDDGAPANWRPTISTGSTTVCLSTMLNPLTLRSIEAGFFSSHNDRVDTWRRPGYSPCTVGYANMRAAKTDVYFYCSETGNV